MAGTIFIEQLKRIWKQILYWGAGLGGFGLLIMLVIPDSEVLDQYSQLLESMPPFLLNAFGASDIETLATAEGFISLEIFSFVVLLLAAYGVSAGLNIIANDEEDGSLDVLLALPIPRWRIIIEKYAAYAIVVITTAISTYLGLYVGNLLVPLEVDMSVMAAASFNLIPITLAVIAFTVFVAGLSPRRSIVFATSAIFVIISYFLYTVANAVSTAAAEVVGAVSIFNYYDVESIIINGGLVETNVIILLVLALVLLVTSLFTFERRDVGV